jgi:MoaA/NifB/PqqE/SkfB family radical SAM enzyme
MRPPRRDRPLRALQVEVTTRCTRACAVCPRVVLGAAWLRRDLAEEAWAAVVPGLALAGHVHLQGWGEPLLHPLLPEMAAAAKAAGCEVGITTNGDLLPAATPWLLELPVDLVTVSVGGGEALNPGLRGGSSLAATLAAAGELAGRARRRRPRVQVSFLVTGGNADGLEEVVRAAARHGIAEVFAVHLDCTPAPELLAAAAFGPDGLAPGVEEAVLRAAAAASEVGIRFRAPARRAQELLVCALDPTRFAFVAADGRVGPCVYLLLPAAGAIPRVTVDGITAVEPVCFGSLPAEGLQAILDGESRRRFTAAFAARHEAERRFLAGVGGGIGSVALERLAEADRAREESLASHPFPAACAGCHKASGW